MSSINSDIYVILGHYNDICKTMSSINTDIYMSFSVITMVSLASPAVKKSLKKVNFEIYIADQKATTCI